MGYRVGVEDVEPHHYVAWAFDAPGSFGSGKTKDEALDRVKAKLGGAVEVVEDFKSKLGAGDYIINALFEDDLRPVATEEIAKARSLLEETLISLIHAFERRRDPQAADVVNHVSRAERWYFDRLNLSPPREGLSEDPAERLRAVHRGTLELLPRLVNESVVTEKSGEKWSARKVLRRTLWHRQDHLQQLERA